MCGDAFTPEQLEFFRALLGAPEIRDRPLLQQFLSALLRSIDREDAERAEGGPEVARWVH